MTTTNTVSGCEEFINSSVNTDGKYTFRESLLG